MVGKRDQGVGWDTGVLSHKATTTKRSFAPRGWDDVINEHPYIQKYDVYDLLYPYHKLIQI
ncbi:hypothetical protein H6762_00725 [Candidatus Nomurabacteria bacterium]|nr:hypothetical protein [Candidatus Nomurabacteria bacterium]